MALTIDQLLGTAANFEVLGASAVTGQAGTGTTVTGGDLGIYPTALSAVTNFPPSLVISPGVIHGPDTASQQAQTDANTAYVAFQALPGGIAVVGNLAGQTFSPGLYTATSMDLSVGGTVTLDGGGDPNAQFIFQVSGSTLVFNNGSTVALTNGTQARNVIWLVASSATIGTTAVIKGDIIAQASITMNDGASIVGRLLALTGAVTFSGTTGNTATSPTPASTPDVPVIGTSSTKTAITLSELCFPDITGKTIRAWGIVSLIPGGYTTGGIPFGLVQFADVRTVDFNGFLRCEVYGEEPVNNVIGTSYTYRYTPVTDTLQIFNNGVELSNNQTIPLAILAEVLLFEATWDRTSTRG